MGVFLHAGESTTTRFVAYHSFHDETNTAGEPTVDFTISSADTLASDSPEGWENIPLYLKFRNYSGCVVDDVRIDLVQ